MRAIKMISPDQSLTLPDDLLRALIAGLPDAVLVTGADDRILLASGAVTALLGYLPEELTGKTFSGFIHPDDTTVPDKEFRLAGASGALQPAEIRVRHKDGKWRWMEAAGMDRSEHLLLRGTIVTLRDVSGRKQNEEDVREMNITLVKRASELAESNEELERFAYIASHDLQEPLRMITSFLLLLKKRHSDNVDEAALQYIDFAVEGAERMKKLIRDLLEYSRAGAPHEDYTEVDLNMVLFDVAEVFQNKLDNSGAHLDVGNLPTISGRRMQLQQLFQNLVSNALKYRSAAPPVIEIGSIDKGNHWELFVKDNGIGIDPKFNEKIFVIFQRLHSKSEYSGTGIGLAVCKKIVERHGGQMWVESAPGKGSTFRFTLLK